MRRQSRLRGKTDRSVDCAKAFVSAAFNDFKEEPVLQRLRIYLEKLS
jgi:hypothetical protein